VLNFVIFKKAEHEIQHQFGSKFKPNILFFSDYYGYLCEIVLYLLNCWFEAKREIHFL